MAKSARLTKSQDELVQKRVDEQVRRALEQWLPDVADRPGEEGFRRITQTEKDFAPPAHDRNLRIAYFLYVTNPMAHRIIETVKDFVIGDGAGYHAKDERVQKVLDKFWNDPVNHMDIKQFNKVKELGLYGEQIYPVFINEFTGHVRLGYIDPLNVDQVIPDPGNPEVIRSIVLKTGKEVLVRERNPATHRLVTVPKKELKVIHMDSNPRSPSYGRLVGECFYFAVNGVSNATRGFSDLTHLLEWIDIYDQLLFAHMERLNYLRAFVWDIQIEGAGKEEIKLKKKELQMNPPKAGAWMVHNEKEKWSAVTPDLKATEHTEEERKVKAYILGGAGLPPHWFGEGEDVNRATALAMDTPVFRMLRARQRYVRFMFEHIFRFAVDQAILKKVLPDGEELVTDVHVVLPEFSAKDETQASQTLLNLVNALTVARSQNWISDETAAKLIALVAGKFGMELDAEEEITRALAIPANAEEFKAAIEKIIQGHGATAGVRDDGSPESVPGQAQRT